MDDAAATVNERRPRERAQASLPEGPSLVALERENAALRAELARAQATSLRLAEELAEVEQQAANVTAVCAASHRLHEASSRAELYAAIREIGESLVGVREMAVYESVASAPLAITATYGVDRATLEEDAAIHADVARAAARGAVHVVEPCGGNPGERRLTVCVPVRVEGKVIGAVAIFGLLPHKPRLEPLDHQLFDVIARFAGGALAKPNEPPCDSGGLRGSSASCR